MADNNLLYNALSAHGILDKPKKVSTSSFTRWGKNDRYWAKSVGDGWVFGDFVDGISKTAFENQGRRYSLEERETREYEIAKARREAEELQREQWREAAAKAETIFNAAPFVEDDNHPYLKKKGVKSYGLRLSKFGSLVIPLYDIDGKLYTLQFISPNGDKKFLCGGRKKGCFFTIRDFKERILICEGYATGASIYQATGEMVVVCFDAGNLSPVSWEIRTKYPEAEIIVCADNDAYGSSNTGKDKAIKAGDEIGARIVFPVFKDVSTKPTDWNDLAALEGIDRVYEQISGAFGDKQ